MATAPFEPSVVTSTAPARQYKCTVEMDVLVESSWDAQSMKWIIVPQEESASASWEKSHNVSIIFDGVAVEFYMSRRNQWTKCPTVDDFIATVGTCEIDDNHPDMQNIQSRVLYMNRINSNLSKYEHDGHGWKSVVDLHVNALLDQLRVIGDRLGLCLHGIATQKMKINAIKYPPGDYRGTDIVKYSKSKDDLPPLMNKECYLCVDNKKEDELNFGWHCSSDIATLSDFVDNRKLTYSRMNLCLCLLGEIGELASVICWMNGNQVRIVDLVNDANKLAKVAEEVADVYIYCLHLYRSVRCDSYLTCNLDKKITSVRLSRSTHIMSTITTRNEPEPSP